MPKFVHKLKKKREFTRRESVVSNKDCSKRVDNGRSPNILWKRSVKD